MNTEASRQRLTAQQLLSLTFEYLDRIAKERNVDLILQLIADFGRDIVTADRCTVWLIDDSKNILWTRVAHGVDRIEIPREKGIAGLVASTGKPFITNDPYKDSRFDKEVDKQTGYRTHSILALPISDSTGRMIGVVQVLNSLTSSGKFTKKDQQNLMLAASYAGNQLEAVILQEEIETTQKEIIFTLAETGEMRSKETGNHVKRVAEFSRMLALKYGMDPNEALILKTASPLHDIGKIAIPDSILLKEGPLSDEEKLQMQKHTILGYEMLKHSERIILKAAAEIALHHHEKWDGSGYPAGLSGEKISLLGRITAIADVFDALSNDRVYKKAWEKERVRDLFKEQRGAHFDPLLTKVFLDSFEEFWETNSRLAD